MSRKATISHACERLTTTGACHWPLLLMFTVHPFGVRFLDTLIVSRVR